MNSALQNTARSIWKKHSFTLMRGTSNIVTKHLLHVASQLEEEIEQKNQKDFKKTSPFTNISLVTPKTFTKFLFTELKLKSDEVDENTEPGIELLRNIASNYDYWIPRNNQSLLLYYRLQMLLQRISFLKTVGLTPQQKLKHIEKYPPLLLFSFTDCSYEAKMVYLRGLVDKTGNTFLHLFYPVTNKITASKSDIEQRIATVESHLRIKQPAVIRQLLNMPCFFMEPSLLKDVHHMLIHKHSLPFQYDIDQHTLHVLPPVCDLPSLHLSPVKHFSNKANNQAISNLPTYKLDDILDYRYPKDNGKGNPECLSTFLVKAEKEEEKDRTGGQPLKGIRGFNVPPRQY